MKNRICLIIALILLIWIPGCKNKQETMPAKETTKNITPYTPLPSYKEVFRIFSSNEIKEYASVIPNDLYKTGQDDMRNSFSLGIISLDAIFAAKGHNKKRLNQFYSQMQTLTSLIGFENEITKISPDLKPLLNKEQWSDIESILDSYIKKIEDTLWEKENFEGYTFYKLGIWIETLNRVSTMVKQNYSADKTKTLAQKDTFSSLITNLNNIKSETIINQAEFQETVGLVKQLKAIIDANYENTYTSEQLDQIISLTNQIKETFKK
ncbi:MAG: hypothetical protein ABFC98_04100 [Candidatus Cloacimonas sp.]